MDLFCLGKNPNTMEQLSPHWHVGGGRRQEEISGGHVTRWRAGLCVCAGQWQRSVGPGPSSSVRGKKKAERRRITVLSNIYGADRRI